MRPYATAVLALLTVTACDRTSSLAPVGPSPIALSPTSPPQLSGDIRLVTVTHPPGSTLFLDDCGPSWTGIRGHHLCNDEWRGAFDIVLENDLTDVVVTVGFFDGDQRCGLIYVTNQTFTARHERRIDTSSAIYFTYEPEGYDDLAVLRWCDVPKTTTRLVVELWGPSYRGAPLLRRDFVYGYTFVER